MNGNATEMAEYSRFIKRKVAFVAVCLLLVVLLFGISITIGTRDISFADVYSYLWRHICGETYTVGTYDYWDDYIIWEVRLPRAAFCIIAGAGLAVGGAVMQNVMNNPLADPYSTGISSGAVFGVAVSVILGISVSTISSQLSNFGVILNAFIFAMIPMAFIIAVSPRVNTSPATLILAGVAISYLFNALTTLLMMSTDSETLATVYRWQVGSVAEITWPSVPLMAAINLVGIATAMFLSKKLNILALGDDNAKSLGLNAQNMRLVCLMIVTFMAASVIAYAGIISFIGLISAHIVRTILDSDSRFVIPASAGFGAIFMLFADICARLISDNDAVPIGVMLSFIGAPIFLILIIRQKRSVW